MPARDLGECPLYFAPPLPPEVSHLLTAASAAGKPEQVELALLRANLLAPENPVVLVGLYRHYSRRQRLPEALQAAEQARLLSGRQLGLPDSPEEAGSPAPDHLWSEIGRRRHRAAFGLLRFHLLALRAAGILLLRLGEIAASRTRLARLAALDRDDQLGGARLLAVVEQFRPGTSPCRPAAIAPTTPSCIAH